MIWQLDSRCVAILKTLIEKSDNVGLSELTKTLNVSKRSIYYDLGKINDWLSAHRIPEIENERTRGIFLTQVQREKIQKLLVDQKSVNYYVFSPKERQRLLICSLLGSKEPLFVEQLCKYCDVSRNTVFADMKIVRQKLEKYGLNLEFENHNGYAVEGPFFKQKAVFLYYLTPLIPLIENRQIPALDELPFYDEHDVRKTMEVLREIESKLQTSYVEGMIFGLATLIYVLRQRREGLDLTGVDVQDIVETKEFLMIDTHFDGFTRNEKIYIAIHLLGSRVQIPIAEEAGEKSDALYDDARELVLAFERLACIEFEDKEPLVDMLAKHLQMSIYRYKYGIQIGNPLMADIVHAYPDLFEITSKSVSVLKQRLGMPIPESEIAYITLHFGGYLRRKSNAPTSSRVLLVCPNGISTAYMLRAEVESLHPDIVVSGVVGSEDLEKYLCVSDFIISTVDVNCRLPVIRVNPVLTEEDRIRILSRIAKTGMVNKNGNVGLDNVLRIIQNYVSGESFEKLRKDLTHLYRPHSLVEARNRNGSIRLSDVISLEKVKRIQRIADWQTGIALASAPLLASNAIEQRYIDTMIANVEKFGPYIVIGPKIALAHALPQDGVNSLGFSLLLLDEPVSMMGRDVSMLFVLAPIDKSSHFGIMKDLMKIISKEEHLRELETMKCEDVISFFEEITSQEETYDDIQD